MKIASDRNALKLHLFRIMEVGWDLKVGRTYTRGGLEEHEEDEEIAKVYVKEA